MKIFRGYPESNEAARMLWRWLNSPRSAHFDDFGPQSFEDFNRELYFRIKEEYTWTITHGLTHVVGFIGFKPVSPMAGIFRGLVIDPAFRRQGMGKKAMSDVCSELKKLGYTKLIVEFFADNEPIMNLLRSAGGVEEGYRRNMTMRDGKLIDMRIWSMEGKS